MRGGSRETGTDRRAVIQRSALSAFIIIILLISIVPVQAGYAPNAPNNGISNSSISTYIVVFNDTLQSKTMAVQSASSLVESYGGHVKYRYNVINGMAVTLPDSMAGQLKTIPGVKYVEKDQIVHVLLDEAVPQIGADRVWAEGYNGTGIKVAVLDTGIDVTHPDLNGTKVIAWKDFTFYNYSTPCDFHGHGTHVSGIIAGTGNASGGKYKGVAPNASLIEGKVLDNGGSGYISDIIDGINWAVSSDADIISMSLGSSSHSSSLDEAVDNAISAGVVVVVAAGNSGPSSGSISCPGDDPNAITVGAVDNDDIIASFSSRGPSFGNVKPEISNVGVGVISARSKDASIGSPLQDNNYYMSMSGTSMATPMTSGVVALMLDKDPSLTPAQVKSILERSAKHMGSAVPNNVYGYGRVQAMYAVFNITYNGTFNLNRTSYGFPEGAGNVTIGVSRLDDGEGAATIDYNLSESTALAGRDFLANNGTLAFSPGELFKTFNVTLIDDQVYDGNKVINLTLSNPGGNSSIGANATAAITILEDDPQPVLQFSDASYVVSENVGCVTVTVARSANLHGPVSVAYTTSDGTAKAGVNYTASSGTLDFGDGESMKNFRVPIINNSYNGTAKTVNLALSLPTNYSVLGANRNAVITINDDDPVPVIQFNVTSYTVWENESRATITVIRSVVTTGAVSVTYNITDGTAYSGLNYTATNGTLDFGDGQTLKTFDVMVIDNDIKSANKTINLKLNSTTNGSMLGTNKTATLTILEDEQASTFTYNLTKGWNLISVPLYLENDSVEAFFPAAVRANLTDMWYYNNRTWVYYSGTQGYSQKYAHLTNVTPGQGYWVKLSNNSTFTINGLNKVKGVSSVSSGWSMIGIEGLGSLNAIKVYSGNKDMWYYNNGQWYYYSDTLGYSPKYLHLDSLDPGKGYWVHY
ncbi:peptidase S8 family protein [Methanocella paludicola SANAE]|uniref:Peptidase S8 family protein n=1 Tax=Methanocella paludicola (strain DSM 17711 / JCM 13418 / NBRC 101707 / SANAE) TaxID=304371 RepID=D1Z2F2_METPS|nr:S8 family serine peptidase [Methanocella paludicola]BAI62874.1 peptidase S8 family protein [Methanocella paludicola SANAE]